MTSPSLQSLEAQLQSITSVYTLEDWESNKDSLSRIRSLTVKPQQNSPVRPERKSAKDSTKSLPYLLNIVQSRNPSGFVEPILQTLQTEASAIKHCTHIGMRPRATAVVKSVMRSLVRPTSIYESIWQGSKFYASEGTAASRLLQAEGSIINEGDINGARYRANAVILACHYYARVQDLGATVSNRETKILQEMVKESGKSRSHINAVLRRGRWYAELVNELGLGATLTLGESIASANNLQDLYEIVKVCRAVPGFCQRTQGLYEDARNAVQQAVNKLSDDSIDRLLENRPGQRCIAYPGSAEQSCVEPALNPRVRLISRSNPLHTLADAAQSERRGVQALQKSSHCEMEVTQYQFPEAVTTVNQQSGGEAVAPRWQPGIESSWPQEPVAPETSYNGTMNTLFNGLSQVGMSDSESTMETGTFWDDATYYDRLM